MPTAEPVVREIDILATPETVFEFFVDPVKITRWLADDATLDPRPGGVCHLQPGGPGGGMEGEYLEVDAPKRVVFTWGFTKPGSAVPPGGSTVEVTFTPIPSGTRVRLVHSGLPADVAASHFEGWTVKLGRLAVAAQDIRTDQKVEQ